MWVYVGSGIGAGIIIDGQVFPGSRGFSGEIGHCSIVAGGPACVCGLKGCLEALASTSAITNAARVAISSGEATTLSEASHLDARAIIHAANAGDAVAERVLRAQGVSVETRSIDKFPRMTDYVVPTGVRIADADRVRLGAYLGEGTTIMHEGFVNFNAGTLGKSMVEGRISAGVVRLRPRLRGPAVEKRQRNRPVCSRA